MARSYSGKIIRRFFKKALRKNVGAMWALFIICAAVFFGSTFISDIAHKINIFENNKTEENIAFSDDSDFKIYFLDVGQGDSTLVMCDGKSMLIDAGEISEGVKVVKTLKNLGIKKIDIIIGTHPDSDHIGGLEQVIKTFDHELLLLSYLKSENVVAKNLKQYINANNIEVTGPNVGTVYTLGSASVKVVGPVDIYDDNNNNSISVLVSYGGKKFLFMGDTERQAEEDIVEKGMDLKCDVLKLSHHGSSTSSTDILLDRAGPEAAVISCGKNNKYGHPHIETLEKLLKRNIKMYRTDKQGTIMLSVKEGKIVFDKEESMDFTSGNGKKATIYTGNYILNTKSKKMHIPTCKNVSDIKEENKQESNLDRQTLINKGYTPCGYCKP